MISRRSFLAPRNRRQMAKVRVTLLSGKIAELYANTKKRVDELKTMAMSFDRKSDRVRLRHVWLKYKGRILKEEMQYLYHLLPAEITDEEFEFTIVLRSDSLGGGLSHSAPAYLGSHNAPNVRSPTRERVAIAQPSLSAPAGKPPATLSAKRKIKF